MPWPTAKGRPNHDRECPGRCWKRGSGVARLVPRLNFTQSEFAFGCDGDEGLDTKPFAFQYVNHFIDRGKSVASPDTDEDHYTDRHQYYHITKQRQRSVGQHIIVGLIVKTREVGLYRAEVHITTEKIQGIHLLAIRVEKPPKTLMKCVVHRDCRIRPNTKIEKLTP
jgi:hypothetical protein